MELSPPGGAGEDFYVSPQATAALCPKYYDDKYGVFSPMRGRQLVMAKHHRRPVPVTLIGKNAFLRTIQSGI
jgi:hypothetical protein